MMLKNLTFFLILSTLLSCGQKEKNKSIKIDLKENTEIQELSTSLKIGMTEFMESSNVSYTINDIEKCLSLLDHFLETISVADSKKNGMILIEKTIKALNELNKKCNSQLIETSEREKIADIIIISGHLKGYNQRNEDITEQWRTW